MSDTRHSWFRKLTKARCWAVTIIALIVVIGLFYPRLLHKSNLPFTAPSMSAQEATELVGGLRSYLNSGELLDGFVPKWQGLLSRPIHIDIWYKNKHAGEVVALQDQAQHNLIQLYETFHADEQRAIANDATMVVTFLTAPQEYQPAQEETDEHLKSFAVSGKHGLLFTCNDQFRLMPPLRWASAPLKHTQQAMQHYFGSMGCMANQLTQGAATLTRFDAIQLVQHKAGTNAEFWYDSDRLFAQSDVDSSALDHFMLQSLSWLDQHMSDQGELPYMVNLATGAYEEGNTTIRQWFGSLAVGLLYERYPGNATHNDFLRNVDYNLKHYYQTKGDKGFFMLDGYGTLAANAVAAQALSIAMELDEKYRPYYEQVIRGIKGQLNPQSGVFDSWIMPEDKVGGDLSFAPGASLAALAQAKQHGIIEISDKALRLAFAVHYNHWKTNQALYASAWHLIGYGALYDMLNQDAAIAEAIYTIADHLVGCQWQQTDTFEQQGAYTNPHCKAASTRHMSSAVRVEGLVEAWKVAKVTGNAVRMERYETSIRLGLRHILQGQVDVDNDFYFSNAVRARGALRHSIAWPLVRIDGPGHSVIAVDKVMRSGMMEE